MKPSSVCQVGHDFILPVLIYLFQDQSTVSGVSGLHGAAVTARVVIAAVSDHIPVTIQHLKMEGIIAQALGMKQKYATLTLVLWMATGPHGQHGGLAQNLVEEAVKLTPVPAPTLHPSGEGSIVVERVKKPQGAIPTHVLVSA